MKRPLLTILSAIHGDKQQNERDWVLDQFKTNKSPIMVATDVASRGIGEYNSKPPPPSLPWQLPAQHMLDFTLLVSRGHLYCATLPEMTVSTWFSTLGVLIRCVAQHLLYSYFRSCTVFPPRGTSVEVDIS